MKKFLKKLFMVLLIAALVGGGLFACVSQRGSDETWDTSDASGDGTLVDETDALEDSGITGEGLTYDAEYFPYYGMLDDEGQALYAQICANAEALEDTFVPVVECTAEELAIAVEAVFYDHPEYFWLDTAYSYRYLTDGTCVQVILKFYDLADEIDAARALFDASADEIIDAAAAQDSDYDKEKYVHDAILGLTSYDENAEYNQSAYSALVTGSTVCAGYARAFQYIMTQLGIPTYYCTGYSGGDHAWNIVKLGEGYYNVDLTWDDSDPVSYLFFNRTDSEFASTHTRSELSENLPACTATTYCGPTNTGGPGAYPGTTSSGGSGSTDDNTGNSSGGSSSDSGTSSGSTGSSSGSTDSDSSSSGSDSDSGTSDEDTDSGSSEDGSTDSGSTGGSSSGTTPGTTPGAGSVNGTPGSISRTRPGGSDGDESTSEE